MMTLFKLPVSFSSYISFHHLVCLEELCSLSFTHDSRYVSEGNHDDLDENLLFSFPSISLLTSTKQVSIFFSHYIVEDSHECHPWRKELRDSI